MSQVVINILALLGGVWALLFLSFIALWAGVAWNERKK